MRILVLVLLLMPALAQEAQEAQEAQNPPAPIDFKSVERKIAKQPNAKQPQYGLFLFGLHGEKRVWAIIDGSTLYIDRNADGDLTAPDEKIVGKAVAGRLQFDIGTFKDPATGSVHTDWNLTSTPQCVYYKMKWRGEKITMGNYGPQRETYIRFAPSVDKAPIIVPGWDRPFQFEHWMSGTLQRGRATDFKVFIGNRGDRTGAFSSVDDKFLPRGEYVLATLIYRDGNGKRQRVSAKLTERC